MSFTQEDVLRVVTQHGPIIPNQVKQKLGAGDATMINVYLSNLKEEGKIKFTHLQLGSSKFSYTQEQKPQLENLIEHLNEKDRRTAKKLKEQRVLRVQEQDPLTRVGLQQIKDFAIPIKVSTGQGEEIFYRYFLTSPEEAQKSIREQLNPQSKQEEEQEEAERETEQPETSNEKPQEKEPNQKASETVQEREPIKEKTPPDKPKREEQKSLEEPNIPESELAQHVSTYCEENNIQILSIEEVRKNSELDLVIKLPTAAGKITFYAKAKSKKNSNDGDLAAAILSAKKRMLPALYLTTGAVTNKAKENEELQEITVVELGS